MLRPALLALALTLCGLPLRADCEHYPLPLVVEHYDCLVLVTEIHRDSEPEHQELRVFFCRGARVFAVRHWRDDFQLHAQGDQYVLEFRDFWTAERTIYADGILCVVMVIDDSHAMDQLPWFAAARPMVDLLAPPAEAAP